MPNVVVKFMVKLNPDVDDEIIKNTIGVVEIVEEDLGLYAVYADAKIASDAINFLMNHDDVEYVEMPAQHKLT